MKICNWIATAASMLLAILVSNSAWAVSSDDAALPNKPMAGKPAKLEKNTSSVKAEKAGDTGQSKAAPTFRDCADCPDMVTIAEGGFDMGSPESEEERFEEEGPVHRVTVKKFAIGKTHVTRGQFSAFVKATGHQTGTHCWVFNSYEWRDVLGKSWRDPGFSQDDNHPAVCISWDDANAYAQWLSEKTGKNYRLPSEAEWEYAARANTNTARFWGNDANLACTYANVSDQVLKKEFMGKRHNWPIVDCSDGWAFTAPVATFKPNGFGLYDMLGNAWQWTQDCWNKNYEGAPIDGSAWTTGDCNNRIMRGAASIDVIRTVRAATRFRSGPANRFFSIGFRIVRTLP